MTVARVLIFGERAVRASEIFNEPLEVASRGTWTKVSREEGIDLLGHGTIEGRLRCSVPAESLVDLFFEALDRQVASFEQVVDRNAQAEEQAYARQALVTLTSAFMARGLESPDALDEAFAMLGAIEMRVQRMQAAQTSQLPGPSTT